MNPGEQRRLPFDECLKECQVLFKLGFTSDLCQAIDQLDQLAQVNIYYCFHQMLLCSTKAGLSSDKEDVQMFFNRAEMTLYMCDLYRPSRPLRKFFSKQNYNDYTDDNVLQILIKSVTQTAYGLQTLLMDHNLITLVKAAMRMQEAMCLLKECKVIMEEKTKWKSNIARSYFENMCQLFQAYQSLILSHFPERVTKLVTWARGVECDRQIALDKLEYLGDNCSGIPGFMAKIELGVYELFVVHMLGARPPNATKILDIADRELVVSERSSWGLLYKAFALEVMGDIDGAVHHFHQCIDSQKEFTHLHNVCHWDMAFCHGIKMQWDEAVSQVDILIDNCNWSKAIFVFAKASFLYMKMLDEMKPEMKTEISELFKSVPNLRDRSTGKSLPLEKYVCVRAEDYFKNDESLPLPAFDLFYIWNIFSFGTMRPKLLDPIVSKVKNTISEYSTTPEKLEDYCLLLLILGTCYKYQDENKLAASCFDEIFEVAELIENNRNLLPMAALEMGLTKLNANCYSDAEYWLQRAVKYEKYYFKARIHFRAHSAFQLVDQCLNK